MPQEGRVRVRLPDGSTGTIVASEIPLLPKGAQVIGRDVKTGAVDLLEEPSYQPKTSQAEAIRMGEESAPLPQGVREILARARADEEMAARGQSDPRVVRNFDPRRIPENMPMAGAVAGSMVSPVVGSSLGAAGGEGVRQIMRTAMGESPSGDRMLIPRMKKEGTPGGIAEDMALEGAINAAIGGVFKAGGKLVGEIVKHQPFKHVSVERAGQYVAEEMGGAKFSPEQFGSMAQEGFDTVLGMAGRAKGDALDKAGLVMRAVEGKGRIPEVAAQNIQKVLEEEVVRVRGQISSGRLSKEMGGKAEGLLEILEKRKNAFASPKTLHQIDEARTDFFKAAFEADPSEAHRISSRLSHAAHQDIMAAIPTTAERQAYEAASTRYRRVAEIAEDVKQLKDVLGDTRVAPEKVVAKLNEAPETAVKAFKVLQDDAPAMKTVRRALFEDLVATGKLPAVRGDVLEQVFKEDATKVARFAELLAESTPKQHILSSVGIPGTPLRAILHQNTGGPIHISARRLAHILDNPIGLDAAEQLVRAPIGSLGAANSMRIFLRLLKNNRMTEKDE